MPFPRSCRLLPPTLLALVICVLSSDAADPPALRQLIDAEIRAGWKKHGTVAAGEADDATFLRRVHLDLVGTIPTLAQTQAYLGDSAPDKRARLVDRLLADPRFATHQAQVWDLALFGRNPGNPEATRKRDGFQTWLGDQIARNQPFDRVVKELLRGEQPGSETFLVQFRSRPEDATEAVTRIFLGTQLQCARCHDHPYEEWTQRDFYGMAGFFVRLVVLDGGGKKYRIGEKNTGEVLFSGSAKDQRPGRKGEPVKPKFLGGSVLDEPPAPKGAKEADARPGKTMPRPAFSRKEKLAGWLTAKENPYFARATVNRVWGQFLGRGLIHPIDDLGSKTPPAFPGLLEKLTADFVAHDFDLKRLVREIVSSRTYQLSARGNTRDALPLRHERARVRPLSAEELLASIQTATGFDATASRTSGGTREWFLRYFGSPTNGQGDFQGGLSEHLFLNNSGEIRAMIQPRKGNLAATLLASTQPWDKRVDQLFLAVLTRQPTEAERKRFVAHLTSESKAEPLVEEAIWALLNSAEFRFNR